VVPPELFCVSPEVILEYWHDSTPEEPFFLLKPSTRSGSEHYLKRLSAPSVLVITRGGGGRTTFSLSTQNFRKGI
jgi:hypothetical protein